ncbi:MAG: tyrosine--tRNA ligase [Fibromonadaceae bacterium]|jgi:tyrosyl-tRNA synthetase|nr:tyrosine--tRNA ligase [Fibromonadaceae bacterium]
MTFPPLQEQMATLMRGVQELVPEDELAKKIQKSIDTGIPLRVKLGVDPTAPDVHLGHTVVMRKLRQFQDLGHQVVLIVGDYTAMIGDPSGRNKTRPRLSHDLVMENAKEYQEQFFKVVKKEQTEIRYNGEWFAKMPFDKITELMGSVTVAQMLEREDFQNRYSSRKPISIHEFMYPLMQGYDSIAIKSDIEIGGTDQKFNVLRGRDLQLREGMEPQMGLFMPILLGTDGEQKMSKSLGNYVGINDPADIMYHKVYNIADSLAESWFELLTYRDKSEFAELIKTDILNAKRMLATDIVSQYHGSAAATEAAEKEKAVHSGAALPSDTPTVKVAAGNHNILDLLVSIGAFASKGEARRMIQNNGVRIGDVGAAPRGCTDPAEEITVGNAETIIQVGKRKFYRIAPT